MPRTGDLAAVQAILETDREWAAFALADLAAEYSPYSEWHIADGALVLVYRGYNPPLLFALGHPEKVTPLLAEIAGEPEMHVSLRAAALPPLMAAGYRLHGEKTIHRMVLSHGVTPLTDSRAERLGPGDYEQVIRLFEDGDATGERPLFFQQSSLAGGVYFGIRDAGTLVAAAGTPVFAPEQSVACIGNVYTRRDQRGRGLAFAVTAAVTAELQRQNIRTIALNVRADNHPAIRIYERLGFAHYCDYQEARAVRV